MVYKTIRRRGCSVPQLFLHEIGGTANHVHLAVTVPPTIEISRWIGQVKGDASHDPNEHPVFNGGFEWQTGYGVVSFGTKDIPWVVEYIRKQKHHHQQNSWFDRLERFSVEPDHCSSDMDKGVETP